MNRGGLFFVIIGLISTLYACEDPSSVGVDFVGEVPITVTYYDTSSIHISTVKFDSLATSDISRLLVGKSKDPRLGTITAKSFFQVGRDSLIFYPDEEKAKYDSLALELVFDGYSYYDTTQIQTYFLYSVIKEIELNDEGLLYNTSDFKYLADQVFYLGEVSFLPRVRNNDPVYLRMDDEYGQALFELLQQKDDVVTNTDDFKEYIKGFVLVPDASNTCIIGLNNETNIKLFYTQEGDQVGIPFPIASNIHFTQTSVEGADSIFQTLLTQRNILSSKKTDNITFLQGGIGLGIRVDFPYLDYIRELGENNLVTDAELILSPVKGSYSGLNPLSTDLVAYKVDKYNNFINEVAIEPTLYYDIEYGEKTYYSIDVSSFLEEQLTLFENDGSALFFTFPQLEKSGSVNRIYFGDEDHANRSYMKFLILNISDAF